MAFFLGFSARAWRYGATILPNNKADNVCRGHQRFDKFAAG
jgi:hypothetical protein